MSIPSDPPRESEDVISERTVEIVANADGVTMIERDDTIIHHEDEDLRGDPNALTPQQREMLRQLTRLHRSLAGPQTLLETAGHFNRPPFPPHPRRSR
jgi:hypothetical protein